MIYLVFIFLSILALFLIAQSSIYFVRTYNSLVELHNDIVKSWANIDVMLKQRNDEIPNLVRAVKGYMKHEGEVLENVAKARSTLGAARTLGEKHASDSLISKTLKTLYAVVENYPALKADESFLKLQKRITTIENQIADRREFYNDAVTIYNTRIGTIPDRIIADRMGFKKMSLFKAGAKDRARKNIEFGRKDGKEKTHT